MISKAYMRVEVPLQKTQSIDKTSKELLATDVTERSVLDRNFGGQGERVTLIPAILNINIQGLPQRLLADFAVSAVAGVEIATASNLTVAKLTNTNIKGVVA